MAALSRGPIYDISAEARTLVVDGMDVPVLHARPDGMPVGGLVRVKDLDDSQQLEIFSVAADLLVVEDDVARVSVLGFCMGGHYVFKAASTDRFDGAVVFYGMLRTPEQ